MSLSAWHSALAKRSRATADQYLRLLRNFCSEAGVTPEDLVEMDSMEVKRLVLDYLDGKDGGYAANIYYAVKSWMKFNDREFFELSIPRTRKSEEKVPTPEAVADVLDAADVKTRAIVSLVAFAGLRLEVIGNHDGSDGLRVGDLPELRGDDFLVVPTIVSVREELSKAGHAYLTFLNDLGCKYLLAYLRSREGLSPDDPLIEARGGGFLTSRGVSAALRKAIRRAGYDFRPYSLRHYFDTRMLLAEGAKVLPRDYRVFWMGHKGDIEAQYTLNKHRLPPQLLEDMRSKYDFASRFLKPVERVEVKQKVVSLEQLESYLEAGWEYVTTLPNGKAIVKRGAHAKIASSSHIKFTS